VVRKTLRSRAFPFAGGDSQVCGFTVDSELVPAAEHLDVADRAFASCGLPEMLDLP
jgi:hypothetical protein